MKPRYILFIIILVLISIPLSAQKAPKKLTVSGTVTDPAGNPVAGAIVLIDNKKTSIITDEKGYYKIRVNTKSKLLSVFKVQNGMRDEEINGRTKIDFIMNRDKSGSTAGITNSEEDEKVNIGYGTIDKKDMSTSVAKIDGTNIKYASYSNIFDMLRGSVPGVRVTGNKVIIQGNSSFYLSSDPLYVVDGIIVSSIDDISPRMVKSVEVLKGAAASIYGSRGSNGVLLIYLLGVSEKKQ